MITAEVSGNGPVKVTITVGPDATCACEVSTAGGQSASAAPAVRAFEQVLAIRLAEVGVHGRSRRRPELTPGLFALPATTCPGAPDGRHPDVIGGGAEWSSTDLKIRPFPDDTFTGRDRTSGSPSALSRIRISSRLPRRSAGRRLASATGYPGKIRRSGELAGKARGTPRATRRGARLRNEPCQ